MRLPLVLLLTSALPLWQMPQCLTVRMQQPLCQKLSTFAQALSRMQSPPSAAPKTDHPTKRASESPSLPGQVRSMRLQLPTYFLAAFHPGDILGDQVMLTRPATLSGAFDVGILQTLNPSTAASVNWRYSVPSRRGRP